LQLNGKIQKILNSHKKKGLSGPFSLSKYNMTKQLEALFNLPSIDATPEETQSMIEENREIIEQVDDAIDKIDAALPQVRQLSAGDAELDELADLAKNKFEDLMDLGMNVDPRFGGVIFQTAGTLLGHAITAKTAKLDKKLKMIQLQLAKAKHDHQVKKDAGKATDDVSNDAQAIVLYRD
jgi:hypothetical protein